MKAVAQTLGVSRSNLHERLSGRTKPRRGYHKAQDGERRTPCVRVSLTFTAYYLDIIPEARIIYTYQMSFAGTRQSASLVTVTFAPSGGATLMTFTEQVAILEGGAGAQQQRLVGTERGMDRLVELVDAEVVGAR